jgi:hypothetical protein
MYRIEIMTTVLGYELQKYVDFSGFEVSRKRQGNRDTIQVSGDVVFFGQSYDTLLDIPLPATWAKLYQNGNFITELIAPKPEQADEIDYDKKTLSLTFKVPESINEILERKDERFNVLEAEMELGILYNLRLKLEFYEASNIIDTPTDDYNAITENYNFNYQYSDWIQGEPTTGIIKPDFADNPGTSSVFVTKEAFYTWYGTGFSQMKVDYKLVTEISYTTSEDVEPEGSGWWFWEYVTIGGQTLAKWAKKPIATPEYSNIGSLQDGVDTWESSDNVLDAGQPDEETYLLRGGRTLKNVIKLLVGKISDITNFDLSALDDELPEIYVFQVTDLILDDTGALPDGRATKGELSFTQLFEWLNFIGFDWYVESDTFTLSHRLSNPLPEGSVNFQSYNGKNYVYKNRNWKTAKPEATKIRLKTESNDFDFFANLLEYTDTAGFETKLDEYEATEFLTDIYYVFRNPDAFNATETKRFVFVGVESGAVHTGNSATGREIDNYKLSGSYLLENLKSDYFSKNIRINGVSSTLATDRLKRIYEKQFEIIQKNINDLNFTELQKFVNFGQIDEIKQGNTDKATIVFKTNSRI